MIKKCNWMFLLVLSTCCWPKTSLATMQHPAGTFISAPQSHSPWHQLSASMPSQANAETGEEDQEDDDDDQGKDSNRGYSFSLLNKYGDFRHHQPGFPRISYRVDTPPPRT